MIQMKLHGKMGMMDDTGKVSGDKFVTDLLQEYQSLTRTYMGDIFYAMASMIKPHYPMSEIYVSEEKIEGNPNQIRY